MRRRHGAGGLGPAAPRPYYLKFILDDLTRWLEEHEIDSLDEIRGNMSLERCPDPRQFERTNYMKVLSSWKPAW